MQALIMVRYGELSVKGRNKKIFIDRLANNIREKLKDLDDLEIKAKNDFLFMEVAEADQSEALKRLQDVFGIQSYSPAWLVERDFEALKEAAQQIVAQKLEENPDIHSFKVATSRSDHSYEMDTMDINRELGAHLSQAFPDLKVQMDKPDLTVRVKVRYEDFIVSTDWILGRGGLPVGSSSRGMLMLSGGIDSPVAGYLAMKRGIRITALHFASPPYTSAKALDKARQLTGKLTRFGGAINFIAVPFTEIQEEIKAKVPEEYLMTVTRRFMLRIADKVRRQYKAFAIINGESVGQVASQTLESMYAINAVTSTPILRPLACMDKLEIIDIAKDIDTYELSIQPYEDCCTVFAPPSPKTRPHLDDVERHEEGLDIDGLVQRAVDGIQVERITPESFQEEEAEEAQEFKDLL